MHAGMTTKFSCRSAAVFLLLSVLAGLGAGCSDTTSPATERSGNHLDPGDGSFALKDIFVPGPEGAPVPLRLEGSRLLTDPATGTVSIAVKVRNLSLMNIAPPLVIWLSDFSPTGVVPSNADYVRAPFERPTDPATGVFETTAYGYDYSDSLGNADGLPAGEATAPKLWIFENADFAPFAFAARAAIGPFPGPARLGGAVFVDLNGNGQRDRGEMPFVAGAVRITGPGDFAATATPGPDGLYETSIAAAGLYELLFESFSMSPLPVNLTTPNPLTVIITADADGTPRSFLKADFGVAPTPPPAVNPIGFTERRPEQLHAAPWTLLETSSSGPLLKLRVGYSGCQPDHLFSLWMSGGFQESMPPRATITLVHSSQEMCAAYFESTVAFDLAPMFRRYLEAYGAGPLILDVRGPDGFRFEYQVDVVR